MLSGLTFRLLGALCACLILVMGCARTPPETKPFVPPAFPPPPQEPRFIYEHSLFSSVQVKGEDTTSRWRRILTGETESGTGFSKPFDVAVCRGRVFISDSVGRIVHGLDDPVRLNERSPGRQPQVDIESALRQLWNKFGPQPWNQHHRGDEDCCRASNDGGTVTQGPAKERCVALRNC